VSNARQKRITEYFRGGVRDTATVLRVFLKVQRARMHAAKQKKELREPLGGVLDTPSVLRVFLKGCGAQA
jgi:hypothetical protein